MKKLPFSAACVFLGSLLGTAFGAPQQKNSKASRDLTPGTTNQITSPVSALAAQSPTRTPKPHKNKKVKRVKPEEQTEEFQE